MGEQLQSAMVFPLVVVTGTFIICGVVLVLIGLYITGTGMAFVGGCAMYLVYRIAVSTNGAPGRENFISSIQAFGAFLMILLVGTIILKITGFFKEETEE